MSSTVAHCWVDPPPSPTAGLVHYLAAGTPKLQEQARQLGWRVPHLLNSSGMVVNPAYYERPETAADAADPALPMTGLIFFGGFAPARTLRIVQRALRAQPDMRWVVICGHNQAMFDTLSTIDERVRALGFIPPAQVRAEMRAAAFVLGKPGPGVMAEAAVSGVPFVVERKGTMHHELGSLHWLEKSSAGVVIESLESLPADLAERLAPCRGAIAQMDNRAVFEVATLVESLVPTADGQGSGSSGATNDGSNSGLATPFLS